MAKKRKSTKKTTKKQVAKTRKPNRYNELRKVVSKYCLERYNHRCTNDELNRVYRAIKSRYFDKKKSPPLREIIRNIDVILEFKYNLDFDDEFRNKINQLNLRFSKNSKYVNSIIEYPDLVSN